MNNVARLDKKKKEKKYATIGHPTIHALVHGLYRFASDEQAKKLLAKLKNQFVFSNNNNVLGEGNRGGVEQVDGHLAPSLLWIRGFEVTKEEIDQGYVGHFALAASALLPDGKYTLKAYKLASELAIHPQRKRQQQQHPNWGHPILRDIKNKRVFDDVETAQNELIRLHTEFPEISIPSYEGLLVMVYEKAEGVKSPIQKYKLEIKPIPEGGALIDFRRNVRKQKSKLPELATPEQTQGYFTSMLIAKRKKNPRKSEGGGENA